MYHFLYIFTVLTLCTLPTFGASAQNSEKLIIFEVHGKFSGISGTFPSGIRTHITPSPCKPIGSYYLSGKNFEKSYQCPSDTSAVTIKFYSENNKHYIEQEDYTITLEKGKKKYKIANDIEIKTRTASSTQNSIPARSVKNNNTNDNFDFAAASATQNASSGLLLATPAQEDEPQQKASAMSADISGTIDTNDALLLGMTHLDVTPCTLRDSMSLTYQNFKKQITCPIGTKSMTITFTTKASDYKIENPKHVISLSPEKQKYTLPETIKISVKPEKKSTASMADVCKNSAGRLDCTHLTITCTNGFNDDWNEQNALDAMCPNEVKSEQARREKLKNDAESRFCKSGMKFEADCSANKVVFGCSEYRRRAPNEIERNLQNYCSTTKTNTVEIQDETTQKRADKEANEEKLKKICEESGTKGKWNKTLDKCNCNEKNHIFDKETGCGETTTAFKNNKEHLDNLTAGLEIILQELADGQPK